VYLFYYGQTPLSIAAENGFETVAAANGHEAVITLLLEERYRSGFQKYIRLDAAVVNRREKVRSGGEAAVYNGQRRSEFQKL
jgi:hypothetical protein